MSLTLKAARVPKLAGETLVSDGRGWLKPTGIYIPPGANLAQKTVNVLLWVHGWYVTGIEELMGRDAAKVREEVLQSHKNVVLAAPYLGHGFKGKDSTFSVAALSGAGWGKRFLDQVIDALGTHAGATLQLGNLVIACHSGGGEGMRYLVGTLGPHAKVLRECWGFDCLYGAGNRPDDANFWYGRAGSKDSAPLYVIFGPSTTPQSVKLYLMSQGLATGEGAKRDPKGPTTGGLNIKPGVSSSQKLDDLMDLATIPAPPPKPARAKPKTFAEQAADNLSKKLRWPKDIHYQIARDGLLERLNAAGFL